MRPHFTKDLLSQKVAAQVAMNQVGKQASELPKLLYQLRLENEDDD